MNMPFVTWERPSLNPEYLQTFIVSDTKILTVTSVGDELTLEFSIEPTPADLSRLNAELTKYGYTRIRPITV